MKKLLLITLVAVLVLSLASCDLFKKTTTTAEPCRHEYEARVVDPTCSAEGYTEHVCLLCGESYQDTPTAMTPHRFNGGDCVVCEFSRPTTVITPDASWYTEGIAVYTITTAEELAGVAQLINGGTSLAHMQLYLGANIDLEYKTWTPIGTAEFPFDAKLDGNGYTISNLVVSASGSSYAGLFGNVTGELTDFNVMYASVFAQGSCESVGIVAGNSSGRISNVKAYGFVDAKNSNNVGGIVGSTSSTVCFAEANVEVVGSNQVGGIIGSVTLSPSVFEELVNLGNVKGNDYVGGILGKVTGTNDVIYIDQSENSGNVTGKSHIGGIAGYIEGKDGSIIQTTKSGADIKGDYYVGGLVGEAVNVSISNCSNAGTTVSASSCLLVNDQYYAYLGGYVGKGYFVEECVNDTEIEYLARGFYVGGIAGYLTNGVSNCTNNATIEAYDGVGGIAGYVATSNSTNVLNLINNAAVSGKSKVGGIAGEWQFSAPITLGEVSNTAAVEGTSFVGGLVGTMNYTTSSVLTVYNASNTGDVYGTDAYVGGLFGFVNGKDSSSIANSSVTANIKGLYFVGGLVGKTDSIHLMDSTNEGSTVSATGFVIEGEENHAYLGGYVGYGYKISDCVNDVDITYDSLGSYIGGIAGYVIHTVKDCSNNGDVTASNSTDVGGVVGIMDMSTYHNVTHSGLTNTGNIVGKYNVGGIVGRIYQKVNFETEGCDNHYGDTKTYIDDFMNSGAVSGDSAIGGIAGAVVLDNTWAWYHNSYPCYSTHDGFSALIISNMTNEGAVEGKEKVGEMVGNFWTDGRSSLTTYTVTGKVTVNGEALEGTYDVGANTNLTLSGREGPEAEEAQ